MMERVQPSLNTGSALAKMQLITKTKTRFINRLRNPLALNVWASGRTHRHTQTHTLALTSNKHTHTLWASGRALGTVRFSSVNKVKRGQELGKIMYIEYGT